METFWMFICSFVAGNITGSIAMLLLMWIAAESKMIYPSDPNKKWWQ